MFSITIRYGNVGHIVIRFADDVVKRMMSNTDRDDYRCQNCVQLHRLTTQLE